MTGEADEIALSMRDLREVTGFATLDEFKSRFRYLDLESFLARHHVDDDRLASADLRFFRHAHAPPASVASHASPQAFASSRTRRM